MITNLPPPPGAAVADPVTTVVPDHQVEPFSHYEDEFQAPQQQVNYAAAAQPPNPQQYYQQQQYYQPSVVPQPQQPNWHHQHGYYHPYPPHQPPYHPYPHHDQSYLQQQQQQHPQHPQYAGNGYYEQQQTLGGGHPPQNGSHNCTPSPLANSDDSGGDCVNEKTPGRTPGLITHLIPKPKGPRPTTSVMSAKRGGKRARQRDPNEPQKPVSAYALFFRDVQAGIKARNPAASFGEVSKHVAALWDGMDPDSKGAYKRRTEQAKKEYLRQLAAYRATLVSKGSSVDSGFGPDKVGPLDAMAAKGDDRTYLAQRMTDSSGYGPNCITTAPSSTALTPLGSTATTSSLSPQSTVSMGQSPTGAGERGSNGFPSAHHNHPQHSHMTNYHHQTSDPYNHQHQDLVVGQSMMTNCKRPGCTNMVRTMSNNVNGHHHRPMLPEFCSNECLVSVTTSKNTSSTSSSSSNPYAPSNWEQQQQSPPGSSSSPPK